MHQTCKRIQTKLPVAISRVFPKLKHTSQLIFTTTTNKKHSKYPGLHVPSNVKEPTSEITATERQTLLFSATEKCECTPSESTHTKALAQAPILHFGNFWLKSNVCFCTISYVNTNMFMYEYFLSNPVQLLVFQKRGGRTKIEKNSDCS
jgi:hypothetical protein